jgi:hypothetical protein
VRGREGARARGGATSGWEDGAGAGHDNNHGQRESRRRRQTHKLERRGEVSREQDRQRRWGDGGLAQQQRV